MPDWLYLLIAVVYFALLAWALDADCRAERRFFADLKLRPPVSDQELVTRYFGSQMPPEIPIRTRRILEQQFGFPVDRLLPDDDFMKLYEDLDLNNMALAFEEEFGLTLQNEDLERSNLTLRTLSELVATKLQRQLPSPFK
jgi:acyl carrier protein